MKVIKVLPRITKILSDGITLTSIRFKMVITDCQLLGEMFFTGIPKNDCGFAINENIFDRTSPTFSDSDKCSICLSLFTLGRYA